MKYLIILLLFSSCKVYIPENGKYLTKDHLLQRMTTKIYHYWDCPPKP